MNATIHTLRLIARAFFRRIEVTGLENVPETGGGLLISWHPNAMVDAGLILTRFPRRIVFGARHGLFEWPLLGRLMRHLGTVPIYRGQDEGTGRLDAERQAANTQSLDALAREVADGSFAALFPEGISHDEPFPQELKTGAARLFYRACELTSDGSLKPVVIPVGLHYDQKSVFGSNALVAFHPPLQLDSDLATPPSPGASYEESRAKYRRLTSEFERALHDVVHATESWELHHLLHRGRKLVRAERARRAGKTLDRPNMEERQLGFARLWEGYRTLVRTQPQEVHEL
ncbi:MAG: 1-acyl-sn-glycerol-3-phosphate acyltransferase, partial [Vicinamibacteria bacterium]